MSHFTLLVQFAHFGMAKQLFQKCHNRCVEETPGGRNSVVSTMYSYASGYFLGKCVVFVVLYSSNILVKLGMCVILLATKLFECKITVC
jgi:hypothetical protein